MTLRQINFEIEFQKHEYKFIFPNIIRLYLNFLRNRNIQYEILINQTTIPSIFDTNKGTRRTKRKWSKAKNSKNLKFRYDTKAHRNNLAINSIERPAACDTRKGHRRARGGGVRALTAHKGLTKVECGPVFQARE